MVAERPSWCAVGSADKDRRRIANLWIENQQLAVLYDSHTQCAGFQRICNCHMEERKNVVIC